MGLNDNIYSLKNAVESQTTTATTKSMQKYKVENSLLIKLEYYINKYIKSNKDVYNCDIQDEIIQKAIASEFGEEKDVKQMTPSEFVENYTLKEEKRDRDYYYIYCMRHYLQCCRNVNNYIRNKKSNEDDYKKQIALEKWELQRQKLQLQIEKEKQKQVEKQQAEAEQKKNNKVKILLAIGCLICAPVFIFALLLIGIINAAANSK